MMFIFSQPQWINVTQEHNIGLQNKSQEADSISWQMFQRSYGWRFNTLRPRQNGRHFADDILKCIFLNENVWIPIKISLKFVPKGPINNIPALVQIMALRGPGHKPLSEPVMVRLSTHICQLTRWGLVTPMQWLTHLPLDKMAAFWQKTISDAVSWMKMIEFQFEFHKYLFQGVQLTIRKWLYVEHRQAITWTNVDQVQWRIYTTLGRDGLTHCGLVDLLNI